MATIEHKKALMDGGTDKLANLAAACLHCNQHRGQQMHEARQRKAKQVSKFQIETPPQTS